MAEPAEARAPVPRLLAALEAAGSSRAARLEALAGLRAALAGQEAAAAAAAAGEGLLRPLARCMAGDPAERCREEAVELLGLCLARAPPPGRALPLLLPALARRLGPDAREPCEELRLGLLRLLGLLLRLGPDAALAPHLPDALAALRGALQDPFPQAQRQACALAAQLAAALPEHFHMQSESLISPLMQAVSHQHFRVRCCHPLMAVIQFGNAKSLDDVLSHLAQRCFDDIPQVREAVIIVMGEWLLHLRDRYSFFPKLIPLLLSGLADEMHENRELALSYWKKVGLQWEKENEDDIKDKLDFYSAPSYYPHGEARPGLGCRELVTRHLYKILPGLCRDMTDWVVGTRIKASRLLSILLQHAEDHITQHMELLLRTLYRACSDEEILVSRECLKAAELIGTFVSPTVSLKLILSDLEKAPQPPHLMVLSAVIRGSPRKVLQPHLVQVADTLSHPHISQCTAEVSYLEQLLGCVEALLETSQEDCKEIGLQLTKILVTVMAIPTAGHLHEQIEEAMKSLAEVQGLAGLGGLYRQHISELMHWVSSAPDTWTCYSSELLQLDVIATHSGPAIGEALEELFLILKTCLQTSKDPLMRLKLFSTFSQLLQEPNKTINSQGQFCNYLEIMIKDILAPNLQWQGGRTAAAIRTTAVSCLWALIYSELLSPEETLNIERSLLPEILATLDEDSKMTRSFSCQIISVFLAANGKQFEPDKLISVYPELLKRLDDASHEVRLEAAKALVNWFRCIDDDKKALLKTNIEFLYRELLVELDDPNQNIQLAVLDILKQGGILYPDLLVEEIKAVLHKHRSPTYLNQLLLHIESTGWSYSKS
ncbi:LOW QUALITY PROTEIN: dynein axonemal assembly factor 5 [Sphaerodactylus townsendi]|uniref:LOW QUALITY PROTEIN: dynein axonemal assembly factor 5 n=1 Tax=Sphaerodactylus townsendi TaxID=933632 RepID=UPI0020263C2F|nr:LOW QUALITY PROTEIN: dynein axonemal assembly factor 5 [Sphaerodactylus townsendi]